MLGETQEHWQQLSSCSLQLDHAMLLRTAARSRSALLHVSTAVELQRMLTGLLKATNESVRGAKIDFSASSKQIERVTNKGHVEFAKARSCTVFCCRVWQQVTTSNQEQKLGMRGRE
jgi:hypothetical protein